LSEDYAHYLTTEEASQALSVSRRTLVRYKSLGKITPIRVNNKDMYAPEELARFSACAESDVDVLRKQHLYNSERLVQLEARVALLESMFQLRQEEKLSSKDVNLPEITRALSALCRKRLDLWDIATIEDLVTDLGRLSDKLLRKLSPARTALQIALLALESIDDDAKGLLRARANLLLDKINAG
jgi:hypothetical protein